MNKLTLAMLCAVFLVSAPTSALNVNDEVQRCAAVAADDSRLKCFDDLSASLLNGQSENGKDVNEPIDQSQTNNVASTESNSDEHQMSETIGGRRFASEEERAGPITSGHITYCQQSYDKKWLFVFDNGQIWKQSDSKRHRFKECDFDVTIDKDVFGYFMLVGNATSNKSSKVRINRKK